MNTKKLKFTLDDGRPRCVALVYRSAVSGSDQCRNAAAASGAFCWSHENHRRRREKMRERFSDNPVGKVTRGT